MERKELRNSKLKVKLPKPRESCVPRLKERREWKSRHQVRGRYGPQITHPIAFIKYAPAFNISLYLNKAVFKKWRGPCSE